eukprot:365203-Chlamydomonas_euryale.AAC.12
MTQSTAAQSVVHTVHTVHTWAYRCSARPCSSGALSAGSASASASAVSASQGCGKLRRAIGQGAWAGAAGRTRCQAAQSPLGCIRCGRLQRAVEQEEWEARPGGASSSSAEPCSAHLAAHAVMHALACPADFPALSSMSVLP